jgi:MFS family permease
MYFAICIATIIILRRQHASKLLEWCVPFGVMAAFLSDGLRPEPFSVAVTLTGYILLESWKRGPFRLWTAFVLLLLGAIAAPRTGFFAPAMAASVAWPILFSPGGNRSRWTFLAIGALAFLFVALVFSVMIHFKFAEFRETFHLHATRASATPRWQTLRDFVRTLSVKLWPFLLLTFVLTLVSFRHPFDNTSRLILWLVLGFIGIILAGGEGHGTIWYAFLLFFLSASSVIKNLSRSNARLVGAAAIATLLMADSTDLINVGGILTRQISPDTGVQRASAQALWSTPGHAILVDTSAARYVFDYRLPDGFLDFDFSAPFPGMFVTDTPLVSGDIFILCPPSVDRLNRKTHLDLPLEKWDFFHIEKWSQFRRPRESFIIPVERCETVQPK